MKLKILAVRDRATDQYGTPMFLISTGQGIRSFTDEINKPNEDNLLNKHPEDYDLYEIGEYDTDTADFETSTPRQVAIGKDLKVKK